MARLCPLTGPASTGPLCLSSPLELLTETSLNPCRPTPFLSLTGCSLRFQPHAPLNPNCGLYYLVVLCVGCRRYCGPNRWTMTYKKPLGLRNFIIPDKWNMSDELKKTRLIICNRECPLLQPKELLSLRISVTGLNKLICKLFLELCLGHSLWASPLNCPPPL